MKNNIKYKKALFFFAHPDDETLSAGGLIHKLSKQGAKIKIVIASEGLLSRESYKKSDVKKHLDNLYQACSILGVNEKDVIVGTFKDNSFDSEPLLNLVKFLSNIVNKFKPEALFTHHKHCTNIDHKYCHEAAIIATRPIGGFFVDLFSCETISSSAYSRPNSFDPNYFCILSEKDIQAKKNAIKKFQFEIKKFPHMRSVDFIDINARYRGGQISTRYAEAYMVNNLYS